MRLAIPAHPGIVRSSKWTLVAAGPEDNGIVDGRHARQGRAAGEDLMTTISSAGSVVRCRSGFPRQGEDYCDCRLQPLARAARGALHPSVHRHGLRFQRVLAAAVACDRSDRAEGVSGHVAGPGAVHHHLRLEGRQHGLDVHAVFRVAGHRSRGLGRLARARRPTQGRFRLGLVLVRRPFPWRNRHHHASIMVAVARLRRDRRHRSWPRLYLAGVDAGEVVPGSPRHGDRHGHHGFWWWRHDRCAAGEPPDELLQDFPPRSAFGKPSSRWA